MHHQLLQELRTSLIADRSNENRQKWTKKLIQQDIEVAHLLPLLDEEHPIGMRFTWLLGHLLDTEPSRIVPIVTHCFNRRNDLTFPGIKRTIAKMLWLAGVPEEIEGLVVDELFKWVLDPKIKVAVKVYSIDALCQLTFKYPDLKDELLAVIDDQLDKNSVAFRARAKRVLKQLEKL